MKYRILIDYGAYEGMRFEGGEYGSVDEAVKAAMMRTYGTEFLIVQVVEWQATAASKASEGVGQ